MTVATLLTTEVMIIPGMLPGMVTMAGTTTATTAGALDTMAEKTAARRTSQERADRCHAGPSPTIPEIGGRRKNAEE
jgi:hypothetical protein